MPKAKSRAQYNLFAGVANGSITNSPLTKSEARQGDSGVKVKKLPQRTRRRKKKV